MARHLNYDRWFTKMPNGNLKGKRVSKKLDQQFPREYRNILKVYGPANLTRQLMMDKNLGLAEAWNLVKSMCND